MSDSTTRVSMLTPAGRGAVAVVVAAGPKALEAVDRCFCPASRQPHAQLPIARIAFGRWGTNHGEELVVCRRSEDEIEIHCHGGSQSTARIVADLEATGCRTVSWQESIVERHTCPLQAAAALALAHATTVQTAAVLLDQYQGALRREIEATQTDLQAQRHEAAKLRLQRLVDWSSFGLHLTQPWRVVIAGPPNVGKSTLINALLGYRRAIVFDQPGTTRDVVSATTAIGGWPIELCDTAGLRSTSDPLESAGIARAAEQVREADLVVWVLDTHRVEEANLSPLRLAQQQAEKLKISLDWEQALVALNKIDLLISRNRPMRATIATSALTGLGVEALLDEIAKRLVPQVPPSGSAVPFSQFQIDQLVATIGPDRGELQADPLEKLLGESPQDDRRSSLK